jgi:hypothetical protein
MVTIVIVRITTLCRSLMVENVVVPTLLVGQTCIELQRQHAGPMIEAVMARHQGLMHRIVSDDEKASMKKRP